MVSYTDQQVMKVTLRLHPACDLFQTESAYQYLVSCDLMW